MTYANYSQEKYNLSESIKKTTVKVIPQTINRGYQFKKTPFFLILPYKSMSTVNTCPSSAGNHRQLSHP